MTVLHHDVTIARSPDEVFRYASDPTTWPSWHPTTVAVRAPAGPGAAGQLFHETIHAGRVRGEIAWRVVEAAGRRFVVEGEVDFPLMKATQVRVTYVVDADGAAARFRRELRYAPRALVSRLADRLFFRGHNGRQSVVALARLKRALES